jgi:alpha-ketoglutarate-dependent taurine dioxygenase
LKIIKTPEDAGGDTLWASGYEAFDRLSPTWQRFAETLTATHYQVSFIRNLGQRKFEANEILVE